MQHQVNVGCFGIILDEQGRVLLCHRTDHDLWNLPGGKLEAGESPWDAVIREIREETGLVTTIVRLAGVYSKPEKDGIVFSFVCEPVTGTITLNSEADRIEYFELAKIPSNTPPKQLERIHDAIKQQSKTPVLKVQTGKSSLELIREGKL